MSVRRAIIGTDEAGKDIMRSRMWQRWCAIFSPMSHYGGQNEEGDDPNS
jgi:hypothetical protein